MTEAQRTEEAHRSQSLRDAFEATEQAFNRSKAAMAMIAGAQDKNRTETILIETRRARAELKRLYPDIVTPEQPQL